MVALSKRRKPQDISYDTETTGLSRYHGKKIFGWSTCNVEGDIGVLRCDKGRRLKNVPKLRKFWQDNSITKVMHNAKFDLGMTEDLLKCQLAETAPFHDTMIMSHLLQNDRMNHQLKHLAWVLAGITNNDEKEVKAIVKEGGDYSMVPEPVMDTYQRLDAERTQLLHMFFYPRIQANPKLLECYQNELELVATTLRMEERGVMLNVAKASQMREDLLDKKEDALDRLEAEVGLNINPNSSKQLQWLLFDKLGMPVLATSPKSGQPKTDKFVLAELAETYPDNVVLDCIMQYRSWSKGAEAMQGYLTLADMDAIIHPNIKQNGCTTGRESCSNPNLQNVQKDRGLFNPYPVPERKVFRPRPGFVHIHIDYSGIEMRLLIHYSHDENMIKEMNSARKDPHILAAELFYGTRWRKATKKQRKELRDATKNANFSIPYGSSWQKVCKILGLDPATGKRRFELYKETFPDLVGMNKRLAREGRENGFIVTEFGRQLQVPRNKGYVATNYIIQGTAAGILKRAQNRTWKYLKEATGGEVRPLLPIHDEIVFEYPRNRLQDLRDILPRVRELMIDFPQFSVPLDVSIEIATIDWSKKKEFKL